ncbi:hypothetical protein [Streptomyces griseosporeus]|uniref:hypothetical protein n=1 Tax=Streptomyces griseosporeus TaxID=1910 RepID=UPI0036FEE188
MSLDEPLSWASAQPWPAALAAALLLAVIAVIIRRTSGAVVVAGMGAMACTAYSGDTSWRFAEHRLGMADSGERLVMFAAGEAALLACAVMARANKKATATDGSAGTPGVPGVLVWCITGIQVIPAYSESGVWAGTVRAVIGPVMASMLWHLAMGLEIRLAKPEALSTGLPAQIAHELRERLLSYLGLASRGRTAAQLTRDRATARAVRLASRRRLGPWGRAALAAAVARSGAATDGAQRHQLLQLLAARRNATELRTVPVTSPWVPEPAPEPYPSTPLGVTGAALRRMHPMDAVLQVHAAHPEATPGELAALCTEYGVPVSETQVRTALRATTKDQPAAVPAAPAHPELTATPAPAAVPVPDTVTHEYTAGGLHLDLATETEVRREVACAYPAALITPSRTRAQVHARVPDVPASPEHPLPFTRRTADEERAAAPGQTRTRTRVQPDPGPAPAAPDPESTPGTDSDEDLLARARDLDARYRRTHGRPAPIRALKAELHIGQARAERIREALNPRKASR